MNLDRSDEGGKTCAALVELGFNGEIARKGVVDPGRKVLGRGGEPRVDARRQTAPLQREG